MGSLAASINALLVMGRKLTADGMSREQRDLAIERVLRAEWPKGREWHYLCDACEDTGLRMLDCAGLGCGLAHGRQHAPHRFGVPCHCEKRSRFLGHHPRAPAGDFTQATKGRTKPPTVFR